MINRVKFILSVMALAATTQSFAATYSVTIRSQKGFYLSAEGGGGSNLYANRLLARQWETFEIFDRNGGALNSFDWVCIETFRRFYVVAQNGGGSYVKADRGSCGPWERFQIVKVNNFGGAVTGEIRFPARVAFRSRNGSYMSAEGGGSYTHGHINANRPAIGPWEIFGVK
jgi:hypothetical protein